MGGSCRREGKRHGEHDAAAFAEYDTLPGTSVHKQQVFHGRSSAGEFGPEGGDKKSFLKTPKSEIGFTSLRIILSSPSSSRGEIQTTILGDSSSAKDTRVH